jgi:hypothetical protein
VTASGEHGAAPPSPAAGAAPGSGGLAAAIAGRAAPRVTRVYRDRAGRVRGAAPASPADAQAVIERRAKLHDTVRAYLPPSFEHGLDVQRVDRFLAARGLDAPPVVLLTASTAARVRDGLARLGYSHSVLDGLASHDGQAEGAHFGELGIAVAMRDLALERLNGTAYTEAVLVHEKAHGSAVVNDIVIYRTQDGHAEYFPARRGFYCPDQRRRTALEDQGAFLEEAFAHYLAGEYVRSELGMPNGVWRRGAQPSWVAGLPDLPARYLWGASTAHAKGASGVRYTPAAFAAAGLELLIDRRPELWPALVSARTSVSGLRDVARIIESVDAGLYGQLRRLDYNEKDFTAGLAAIRSSLARSPRVTAIGPRSRGLQGWARSRRDKPAAAGRDPLAPHEIGQPSGGRRRAASRHGRTQGAMGNGLARGPGGD